MANKYHTDSSDTSEYICDANEKTVAFPTAKEFMNAFADAGDDKAQLDWIKENAEKLLKRYTGTDEENKEQIFALLNEAIIAYDSDDVTDEQEDICEQFDDIRYEATFVLESRQKLEMMHATSDHIDTLEIIDDAVERELIQTKSTKELKGWNTGSSTLVKILDDSVDTQFFGYDYCALYVHRKITEQWLTDDEKEEFSKLMRDSKFNRDQMDVVGGTHVKTWFKIDAYNILAATRLAKNILNTNY